MPRNPINLSTDLRGVGGLTIDAITGKESNKLGDDLIGDGLVI